VADQGTGRRPPRASKRTSAAETATETKPQDQKPDPDLSEDGRPKQFSIPAELVEHILLGPTDDRRVLQDSPLLGDVWTAYASDPGNIQDVLITPHRIATAAGVAGILPQGLQLREADRSNETDPRPAPRDKEKAKIAYLQGLVGARLYFDEVLCVLVPLTQWWHQPQVANRIEHVDPDKLKRLLRRDVGTAGPGAPGPENFSSLERYIGLAGLIYWVGKLQRPKGCERPPIPPGKRQLPPLPPLPPLKFKPAFERYQPFVDEIIAGILAAYPRVQAGAAKLIAAYQDGAADDRNAEIEGYIFQVSLNRLAAAALERSVPAVKADAAKSLFQVKCRNIVWAVLDSGIDGRHPAFMTDMPNPKDTAGAEENPDGGGKGAAEKTYVSRVRKTFDFTKIREIVSNDEADIEPEDLETLARAAGLEVGEASTLLHQISADAGKRRPIDWGVVEKLITLKDPPTPQSPHGTHVAGIIGADQNGMGKDNKNAGGMCPDIKLYDFRVLGRTLEDTEFAVIAALQYIRYVNERHTYITIHGANLSLSIPHNVRNYACGRTPVCNECERLIESGVVVVAAAGNRGFQKFETKEGIFESYAAFSITDPGNSDGVITVGSTHGNWPQTYGVSFFSSRGPTGDGRLKPDLVAPGERVLSTVLDGEWAPESGTSMAAPHVSGAAAMLLARYEELIGQPRRVKRILCETATDLGRERSFQGHGMLDVLRAFQSI
jgi:serine protease AprX